MATIVDFIAMSHSPFWDGSSGSSGPGSQFVKGVDSVRNRVRALEPDLIVVFGPDHFRNFFFDLMPAFCIALGEVQSFGDYGGYRGTLPHLPEAGRKVIDAVRSAGFDPAFSLRMGVDHGITQPYEVLVPGMTTPILPIMVNCGAPPKPSLRRSHDFGRAIGEALRGMDDDLRILVMASGGLSHWVRPMSPYDEATDHETREFLIDGRDRVVEYNRAREANLAQRIAEEHVGEVNEEWDRWFLDRMTSGDLKSIFEINEQEMERVAGNGANEVRAWLAGLGAWAGDVQTVAYEPVPRWVTGMGLITGTTTTNA